MNFKTDVPHTEAEEHYIMVAFLAKYDDKTTEDVMNGTCSTGGYEIRSYWQNPRGHLEKLDVDGRMILKSSLNTVRVWTGFSWFRRLGCSGRTGSMKAGSSR
jgi:hypothetical protein